VSLIDPRTKREELREIAIQERIRARIERRFFRKYQKEINRMGRVSGEQFAKTNDSGSLDLLLVEHKQNLDKILKLEYSVTIAATSKYAIASSPKSMTIGRETKDITGLIESILQQWITTNAATRATKISNTTMIKIREVIASGIGEGAGAREIGKAINRRVKSISRSRGIMIARTESHSAMQNTLLETVNEMSTFPVLKKWVATEDERTRETHRAVDGITIPKDQKFAVGDASLAYPGDQNSGSAKEVIQCRCGLVFKPQVGLGKAAKRNNGRSSKIGLGQTPCQLLSKNVRN